MPQAKLPKRKLSKQTPLSESHQAKVPKRKCQIEICQPKVPERKLGGPEKAPKREGVNESFQAEVHNKDLCSGNIKHYNNTRQRIKNAPYNRLKNK